MATGQYLLWKDAQGHDFRPVALTGTNLLNDRNLNKGTAFTEQERADFELGGLLPPQVQTFEAQLERVYEAFLSACSDIEKYQNLRALQDRNETLFYALLSRHVEEMTPYIYTPTVGKACQEFSHRFQKPRGLYITPKNVDDMGSLARHMDAKAVRIIVVTDSQGILGIGDQGVGGMGIPIGKLSLYTLGAGIHPACCLPIALDVGTDNQALLDDPMYLGQPHKRIRGKEYDDFIDKFVAGVKRHFPNAVLQWEDFSKSNAFNSKKVTAHHAIIPTSRKADLAALSPMEKNVYDMVCRSFLAQFFPAYQYLATAIEADIDGEHFSARGNTPVAQGWREVYTQPADDSDAEPKAAEDDDKQTLPAMQKGDRATAEKVTVNNRKTTPPPRYTEGTLQDAMKDIHKFVDDPEVKKRLREGQGIGTEATRPGIIEELKKRTFIGPEKAGSKKIVSSKTGRGLILALPRHAKDPALTALCEQALDAVAAGKMTVDDFLARNIGLIAKLCKEAERPP